MSYVLVRDNVVAQYPYSITWLRKQNPDISFPSEPSEGLLAEHGVFPVAASSRPTTDITKNVVEGTPALVGGVWTQAWSVIDASAGEVSIRQSRLDDQAAKAAVKADAFVNSFVAMTPAQVNAYIEANVTNLASAKTVIGKLALMVLLLARNEFK